MHRITLLLGLFLGMIFMESLNGAESIKAKYFVELEDAEGDVLNLSDPGKDVVKVSIKSDGKHLFVVVTLKDDIKYYLEGHKAGAVIRLHFDTDNNPDTGGKFFWVENTGFDYVIILRTCIRYKNGKACVGGLGQPSTGFFSSYKTKKYKQGDTSADDIYESTWQSPTEDITENIVKTKIPYTEIGVDSGQTIRIVIEEKDAEDKEESYSPDILFELK
jgi:hypothetical protein